MNIIQSFQSREKGFRFTKQYDLAVKRLKCYTIGDFVSNSPAFVCKFCLVNNHQDIFALANEDGMIALQSVTSGSYRRSLNGVQAHHNAIFDLAWMEQEFKLVSVSGDHTAVLWDCNGSEFREVNTFHGHTRSIKTVSFRPQEKTVFATGARDGMIVVWDTRCGKEQLTVSPTPDNFITYAHLFPDTASCTKWKRNKYLPASRISSVTSLVFQDEYSLISCGAGDGLIKVWDLRKSYSVYKREPAPRHSLKYPGNLVKNGFTSLILDPGRVRLYANCMDQVIYCYNVSTYENNPISSYTGHHNSNFYIKTCLSPDGQYLMSGSGDDRAYIWNVNRPQKPIASLVGHDAEVTTVAWCPVGEMKIVTCADDSYHRIWEIGYDIMDGDDPRTLRGWAEDVDVAVEATLPSLPKIPAPVLDCTPKSNRFMLNDVRTPDVSCYDSSPNFATPVQPLCSMCCTSTGYHTPCSHCLGGRSRLPLHRRLRQEGTKRKLEMLENASSSSSPQQQNDLPRLSPLKEHNGRENLGHPKRLFSSMDDEDEDENTPCWGNLPPKKRICLTSPTLNLPNYVLDGTSPIHCCKRSTHIKENIDWLTKLRKEKEVKETCKSRKSRPKPAHEGHHHTVTRRVVVHSDSLLKYFTVSKQQEQTKQ